MTKNIIFILLFPLFSFAQEVALTYDQAHDISIIKGYKNNMLIDSYISKNGVRISVGDTLVIGNAVIKSNRRKKHLFNDVFSYIAVGKIKGTTNKGYRYLPHNYSGSKVIVKSIFVTHEKDVSYKIWPKSNEMPLYVSVFVTAAKQGFSKILGNSRKTILDIEKALLSEEIINNDYSLLDMKEEKTKEDKDKYDLLFKLGKLKEKGLLTEEEFQKEKNKLLNNE